VTTVPQRRPRRLRLWAVGLTLLLAACAEDAPQDTFEPEGDYAQKIDKLAIPIFIIAGVVGLLVFGAIIFVVLRYRVRKGHEDEVPRQVHGHPRLEVMWTVLPALLLAGVAVPTIATLFDISEEPGPDALQITVVGQQWWWAFEYPGLGDGGRAVVTSGEMVIPAGQQVKLNITSRDVIHSFWIPKLNGKRDAVPGRVQPLAMEADQPGTYWGQCAEFCGLSHADMRMRVVALSPADWEAWLENQRQAAQPPDDELALAGEASFAARCAQCHVVNGLVNADGEPVLPTDIPLVSGAAPDLTHLMSRATFAGGVYDLALPDCEAAPSGPTGTPVECLNRTDLEAWLRNPEDLKPMAPDPTQYTGTRGRGMPNLNLTEQQIDELVAYLSTLD
jgi:cytochrome c oxidase subunit II